MKIKSVLFTLAALISILVLLGNTSVYAEEVRGVTNDTIKIGTIVDMTGPAADNLTTYAIGVRNYFKYINDKGGINGRKVKVLVEDDRYSIPMAIGAFKKLAFKDKILTIIGLASPQTTALLSQIEKNNLPTITYSGMTIMTTPLRRYVFTHQIDYKDQAMILIDYVMKNLRAKDARFAVVTGDAVWGKSTIEGAKERLERYGLKLVDIEIPPMTLIDATTEAMNLKRSKANYIIIMHSAGLSIGILRSSKRLGYSPTFLALDSSCPDVVIEKAKDAAKDIIGVWAFNSWFDDTPGIKKMKEQTLKYQPDIGIPSRIYSFGWVAAMIGAEGMKRAGKNLNGETLVSALESIKDFDTGDISGPVSFSSKSHKGGEFVRFLKADLEKERFVSITGWRKLSE